MVNSVYAINRGINSSIEFKGLKAQYIWYVAIAIVSLLMVFALLYMLGLNPYVCIGIVGAAGVLAVVKIYQLSNKYGAHGLMKVYAQKRLPKLLKCNSRAVFFKKQVG